VQIYYHKNLGTTLGEVVHDEKDFISGEQFRNFDEVNLR
jgi:hypothetical protein